MQNHQLTPRELDVLRLVADGRTNDEIAATLKLTPNTIKGYLTVVYEKLGVRTRTQAAIHAIRHRLVE